MKSWLKVVIFAVASIVFVFDSLKFLEGKLASDPGSTLFYVLMEWLLVAVPLTAGATLFIEESFKRPPKLKVVQVDEFVEQITNGKLTLTHEGMANIVRALDKRLKLGGEAVAVGIVQAEKKQTGVQIERSIS